MDSVTRYAATQQRKAGAIVMEYYNRLIRTYYLVTAGLIVLLGVSGFFWLGLGWLVAFLISGNQAELSAFVAVVSAPPTLPTTIIWIVGFVGTGLSLRRVRELKRQREDAWFEHYQKELMAA
jgi:hypothetical protein